MRYTFFFLLVSVLSSSVVFAQKKSIQWADIDTLNLVQKDSLSNAKHIFIDVYTEWCGWCKRMDKSTFEDQEIVEIMNKYFIPVKFDAEQKDPIQFSGREFTFVKNGRRGYNQLAAALLQNKMSYPTVVFLNEKTHMIQPLSGFRSAEDLKPILLYIGKEIYKEQSFQEYLKEYNN